MSWIALDEIAPAIDFLIDSQIEGPVNFVAPEAVSNLEFTKALGRVIKRPTVAPLPCFFARLLFVEMADALLIGGSMVQPKVLESAGYSFQYPRIEEGLKAALKA